MSRASRAAASEASALNTLIAERGGNVPALGYQPGGVVTGTGPAARIDAELAHLIASGASRSAIDAYVLSHRGALGLPGGAISPAGVSPQATPVIGGPLGIVGGLGGLGGGGEVGVSGLGGPAGILVSDLYTELSGVFGGRPRTAASERTMELLLASPSPYIRAVGSAIDRALRAGLVTSSPGAARYIRPALGAAVKALVAQGYRLPQVRALFSSAFRGIPSTITSGPVPAPAPVPEASRFAGRPVHDLRGLGSVSQAEVAGAASPYHETAPALAARVIPASEVPSWVTRAASGLGIEQAGLAVAHLAAGRDLTLPEFGALSGALLGAYAGDPAYGAEVGLSVGEAAYQLDNLARTHLGASLEQILHGAGRAAYNALFRAQPSPVPQPNQIVTQPHEPPPAARQIVSQPQQPVPQPNQIVSQPHEGRTVAQQTQQILTEMNKGPQPETIMPTPPPNTGKPLLNHQPGGCYSEQQISELLDCPNFQKQLQEKFTVRPPSNGHPGQIIAKVPVCVCCDSAADLILYAQTNGMSGSCIQISAPPAELAALGAKTNG